MSITVIPAAHVPKLYPPIQAANSVDHLLQLSFPTAHHPNETRIVEASSFVLADSDNSAIYPSHSSFVHSVIEAWGRHAHLVIRPEDIWITILVQMNFYMESHADQVRHIFVANHKTEKEALHVDANSWPQVIDWFRPALQARLTAPWVSDWIAPGFSTTTREDEQTATILMMGLMKQYFHYSGGIICGIPSVTLRGVRADWQRLLDKIDRLPDFGEEPARYAKRLRPILTRIVKTFDDPADPETRAFWDRIVQARHQPSNICGWDPTNYVVTGWIVGLFYWDGEGRTNSLLSEGHTIRGTDPVVYDGIRYSEARLEDLSMGYARAEFKMVNDHGGPEEELHGWVLAGSIGTNIVHRAPAGYYDALAAVENSAGSGEMGGRAPKQKENGSECLCGVQQCLKCFGTAEAGREVSQDAGIENIHSTIQPLSGWFLFGPAKNSEPFHDFSTIMTSGSTVETLDRCVDRSDSPF